MRENLAIVKISGAKNLLALCVVAQLGAPACASDNGWGVAAEVPVFESEYFYTDNQLVELDVDLPEDGLYSQIIFHYTLSCPQGRCDVYDRLAWVKIVQNPGTADETEIELWRFITPFGLGASWDLDVTDLRAILRGRTKIRAYISTYGAPGSQYGEGWLLDASLSFVPGTPVREAVAVEPIWSTDVTYGDANVPIAQSAPPKQLSYPEGATKVSLRTFVTGHGQGNADNCAEFCPRTHTLTVNGVPHDQLVWRDDCPTTAVPNQPGSWQYPRAGWCPGAYVYVWNADVAATTFSTGQATVSYDVPTYTNSCQPGAPGDPICTGCVFDTGCTNNCCVFNGGNHTVPRYSLSTAAVFYK